MSALVDRLRLIPAHAGKTRIEIATREETTAHPRSRGENIRSGRSDLPTSGSSPLTRGKHAPGGCACVRDRLIPAHAGKTRWHAVSRIPTAAHPRSRGENLEALPPGVDGDGSSPLTRGKLLGIAWSVFQVRLIPAHAGKTQRGRVEPLATTAHPRSRGENSTAETGRGYGSGSSPLTRGKHFLTCAFIAQIDQILESLELCASSESYSLRDAYATDVLQDQVRSIGLAPLSSRGAS